MPKSATATDELEAELEADTDPGVVYEDAEKFKAALRAC
jgi:hypothetical protein